MRFSFNHRADVRGFTLIEVMIAVFVTAIGLLGLAKMQALAISSTQGAGGRSLVAVQVGSLVSAMHANKSFWTSASVPTSFSISGTTITGSSLLSTTVSGCTTSSSCTASTLAAYDVQSWAAGMNQQFPTYKAKVDCTAPPVSCEIYVTFQENTIALNKSTAAPTASQTQTQSFSVFVQP